jgi:dipeptidyl aminopeptidase/acylaminoacyl peptidase
VYRCAVTIAGVFDWEQVLKDSKYDQYTTGRYAYLKRRLGDPRKEKEKYDAVSPGRHVAQVRVPVFVAHGKDDPVASVNESKRLISELKRHDVPHDSLFIGGEGHGMGHLKNQLELYSRIEVFLRKNLAARPGNTAASH